MRFSENIRRFFRNEQGAMQIVEWALLAPLAILMLVSVIDFGRFFIVYQRSESIANSVADALQRDISAGATAAVFAQVPAQLTGGVSFNSGAFATEADARASVAAWDGLFDGTGAGAVITTPNPATPWMGIGVSAPYTFSPMLSAIGLTGFRVTAKRVFAVQPDQDELNLQAQVTALAAQVAVLTPPICNGAGQGLQWNSPGWTCKNITLKMGGSSWLTESGPMNGTSDPDYLGGSTGRTLGLDQEGYGSRRLACPMGQIQTGYFYNSSTWAIQIKCSNYAVDTP